MGWARHAFGFGLGLALACNSNGGAFECTGNGQCGADGTCQPTGFCSFPDTTCPSEQRYGDLAGDELDGTCVPEENATSSDGSTSVVAMSTGSDSTTSTSGVTGSSSSSSGGAGVTSTSASSSSGDTSDTDNPDPLGPVVWYTFDAANGGMVMDASGNGVDGSCASCGDVVSGAIGSALEFGTLDNIILADHNPVLATPELTVSAWISLYAEECMSIISKPLAIAADNSWQVYTCPNAVGSMDLVGFITNDQQSAYVATYDAAATDFVHFAMTFSGEIIRLYINGSQELSMQLEHDLVFDDSPLIVGGEDNGDGFVFPFLGAIDDVRIYDRALSETEMTALFAGR